MSAREQIIHSRSQKLPLMVLLEDIYAAFCREVIQWPKSYKHTLGEDVRRAICDLRKECVRAAKLYKKETALRDADIALELLRGLIWSAHQLKCVSNGQLGVWIEKLDLCGKMIGGWISSVNAKRA